MTKSLIPALVFAAALFPVVAQAQPSVSMSVTDYGVKGVTVNEIIRNLNRHRAGGSWAYTSWRVTRPGCRTRLVIRQTLPKWLDRGHASASVKKKWDSFYSALRAHEAQHVQFAHSAAAAADALGCSADYARVVRKWMATERAFDQRTRHGIKTGAFLRYE